MPVMIDFNQSLTLPGQNLPGIWLTIRQGILMSLTDIPVLGLLKTKMKWHQARQSVLAENIANADTPGFKARDLKALGSENAVAGRFDISLARTNASHLSVPSGGIEKFGDSNEKGWEISPSGNAVVLEEQMMKVTENQMDYQAATTLYARSLALIRTALGGN